MTLLELADWIDENRKEAAFKNYSYEKILLTLQQHIKNNSILVQRNEATGKIEGVVTWTLFPIPKILYVHDILTTRSGVVSQMLVTFHDRFPGYRIEGKHKTGRQRYFNKTLTLQNRLAKYGC